MDRNYWIHRISHKMEVSYPLLEKGYISIGFSDFIENEEFLIKMLNDTSDRWNLFENENKKIWGDKLYKTRYNLWRFLCRFSVGDYVIIPSWGTFSIYEIIGKPVFASEAIDNNFTDWNGNKVVLGKTGNRFLLDSNGEVIDLGFAIRVKEVVKDVPRSDYAYNPLLSRLKIRQTNADVSDLKGLIEDSINRFKSNKPIKIYSDTIKSLSDSLKQIIDNIIDNDQFERLVKCYFIKIGADEVIIPSKHDGKGEADGDIVATFNALKLNVYVQVKHHKGTTGEWAVKQITEYKDQKDSANNSSTCFNEEIDGQEDVAPNDSDYKSIAWVISSADEFTKNAQMEASKNDVKLINGEEFRKMLIDAGLSQIAAEFQEDKDN